MNHKILDTKHGHWILAKMGKRVLRPGGKELTLKLVENLNIKSTDNVVEFAPGMGFTASIVLQKQPHSYTGIELNEEATRKLEKRISGENRRIINSNATETSLPENFADVVYGEAMLTMHADVKKSAIVKEAYRILKKGGLYGIHELSLFPDELEEKLKIDIKRGLMQSIQVNARPLTEKEWVAIVEDEGFKVVRIEKNPMILLEPKRIIDDEGFWRFCKIVFNILTHPQERKRILEMRRVFKKYKEHMAAIVIVAEKRETHCSNH
ncbi:MAG: methyltransferase domain-containing protein [Petrimonas sp.]|uniref:class I SAM-dependent methyltransferase n=1 Tax=Petrimonas sp. TaxID=2023866 RepID=UPI001BD67760|nr:methyltransferase domain-containing protein [Petrimonas sp.]MEA5043947.1 methyltransferase domain-containing protein [Petrimonas sp.]MEA5063512.1 methyltransferase domain-containing protein [Petrimonas sp.]